MEQRFDAVIVGSGFGGSVMAYRLARAGKRVCLLERGKPYPPGSFSRTPLELNNNFWDPSEEHYGLFNIWSFRGMAAVVSAGLGGGSLIYANVLIRKDERWFADSLMPGGGTWPITRAILDPHYDAVEQVLRPSAYPIQYQRDNKTAAMRAAARKLSIPETTGDGNPSEPQWYLPHLAVTFNVEGEAPLPGRVFDPGENYHQAPRETCRLCGECDVGCNYGSKNTLDYNYITLAKRAGAEIRTLTEVKSFAPEPAGGYRISCVKHDIAQKTVPGVLPVGRSYEIIADKLILSAGTLGSTYLLLKMNALGGFDRISAALGTRFSGNGDLLMFATSCMDKDRNPVRMNASRAPVITSTFRFPDTQDNPNEGRGFYLQDAGYPLALDYLWELLDRNILSRAFRFARGFIQTWITGNARGEIDRQLGDLIGEGTLSSTSMPLLGMGRDVPDGQMTTRIDPKTGVPLLQLAWNDARSRGYLKRANAAGRQVARALGGRYSLNPLTWLFNNLITVHPLGGCPMGHDVSEGVVDSYGRVFNYPGLYVADGSIMPGPVGANPSFTIAALSDRIADAVLNDP
ncbi:MAG TPA: GMC family oxidoreductase [Candidatus Rubrimentiphilum sp.]|nr:GMC family oxidoreductase [Candidatus Rubrimentiphilum sp.]